MGGGGDGPLRKPEEATEEHHKDKYWPLDDGVPAVGKHAFVEVVLDPVDVLLDVVLTLLLCQHSRHHREALLL